MRNRRTKARIAIPIFRLFPSAMHLDEIGSVGHRSLLLAAVWTKFSTILRMRQSHLYGFVKSLRTGGGANAAPQNESGCCRNCRYHSMDCEGILNCFGSP